MAGGNVSWIIGLAAILSGIIAVVSGAIAAVIVHPRHPGRRAMPELDARGREMASRLRDHIRAVASRPHNLFFPDALDEAADYIEHTLREIGYQPSRQEFVCQGRTVCNIEAAIEPDIPVAAVSTLVIGAHYDSPDDSPGANDNGTGVAALLEIARKLKARPLSQPNAQRIRLVFFVNEELPWGKTADMGSLRHAKSLKDAGERVSGMLALETLGHFSDAPGSQKFPFPFGLVYGNRGDFVAFVGMLRARSFVHAAVKAFRNVSPVPSIGGVAPRAIEGIDLSDHWAYDQMGFPAAMVTDTAPFRNPYYHQTYDTPDTVDYAMLARVTCGLTAMILSLAREPG